MDDVYVKELVPVIKIEYLAVTNSEAFFNEAPEEDENNLEVTNSEAFFNEAPEEDDDNLEKLGSASNKHSQEKVKTKVSVLPKASKQVENISTSCLSEKNYNCSLCSLLSCDKESILFHQIHCRRLAIVLKDCSRGVVKAKDKRIVRNTRSVSYVCNECGKQFMKKNNLRIHMKYHTRNGLYTCVCGKSFSSKKNLPTHMKIHTGERRFVCKYCGRAFIKNSDLTRHLKTHFGPMLTCTKCSKSFRYKFTLDRHMKLHSGERPYKCDQCDKSFVEQVHMVFHSRLHSGERPYACKKCKKSFVRNSDLIKHNKTVHSNDWPYLCEMCGKSFPLKYYLKVHLQSHCL